MRGPAEQRRVRTGCFPCRKRRRKCDELKPRCENCLKRGAVCQYPGFSNVSARDIISRDIQDSRDSSFDASSKPHQRPIPLNNFENQSPTAHSLSSSSHYESVLSEQAPSAPETHPEIHSRPPPPQRSQTVPNTGAAAHVNSNRQVPPLTNETTDLYTSSNAVGSSYAGWRSIRSSTEDSGPPKRASLSNTRTDSTDTLDEVDLICHYRYNVASWLDIVDATAFFGVNVLSLARGCRAVMAAILAVAARHLGLTDEHCRRFRQEAESKAFYEITPIQHAVRVLLLLDSILFCDGMATWRDCLQQSLKSFAPDIAEEPLRSLCFRLDLAAAVATNQTPLTDPMAWQSMRNLASSPYSQDSVNLTPFDTLATALSLVDPSYSENLSDSSRWTELWASCQLWHRTRPEELCPVVECRAVEAGQIDPANAASFPIELYSSALAILPNVAYHLASLVLLSCRPRLIKPPYSDSRRSLSESWHVQAIAGIACRNEFEKSQWDPILIAAMLYIGPRLTHRAQQEALLHCLTRAEQATRMNLLPGEASRLREGWGWET